MKICVNCGTNLDDGMAFCQNCGVPVPLVCHGCSAEIEKGSAFCQSCGTPVGDPSTSISGQGQPDGEMAYQQAAYQQSAYQKTPTAVLTKTAPQGKKFPKKAILIAAAGVIVIVAVVLGLIIFKPSAKSELLYLKDGQLSLTGIQKIAPFELTDSLFKDGRSDDDAYIGDYVIKSDNGKYLFYPQNISSDDYTMDLYMINLTADNAKNSTSFKIDTGVSYYRTSLDGTKVFYLKDGRLYFFNLKDKEKIVSDISEYYISDDGLRLMYVDRDDNLFFKDFKKNGETEKIDSDVAIHHISADLGKVYYTKNNDLYLKETGKDKVKIDSDVSEVPAVYDSGALYYVKGKTEDKPLASFINDNLAESDAKLTEPTYDAFTKTTTDSSGYQYPEVDYDAYNAAYKKYYEKLNRDALRDELKEAAYTISNLSLYFYDGKQTAKVSDNFDTCLATGPVKEMIAYSKNGTEIPKLNISDITSTYDVTDVLKNAQTDALKEFTAVGAKETQIDQKAGTYFTFNKSGTMLYFLDNYSKDNYTGDLYAVPINSSSVGKPELYEKDVYDYFYLMKDGDSFIYFKNVDTDTYCGDMYINKQKVDTDVYFYGISFLNGKNDFVYKTDVNSDDIGTLKRFDGKKTTKLADDVNKFLTDGKYSVAYLANYDTDDGVGEVYLYTGSNKPKLIDKDVSTLITMK